VNVTQKFKLVFEREVDRLYQASENAPLDAADILKLEKLVSAWAKYQHNESKQDDLAGLSAEDLLKELNGAANPSPNSETEETQS
jgi:hypothetical protein